VAHFNDFRHDPHAAEVGETVEFHSLSNRCTEFALRNMMNASSCCLTNYLAHLCANYLAHKEGSGQPLIRLAR
jgi:hypothetical protein